MNLDIGRKFHRLARRSFSPSCRSSWHARDRIFSIFFLFACFVIIFYPNEDFLRDAVGVRLRDDPPSIPAALFPRLGKSFTDLRQCLSRVVVRIPYRPARFRLIRTTGWGELSHFLFSIVFLISFLPLPPPPSLSIRGRACQGYVRFANNPRRY